MHVTIISTYKYIIQVDNCKGRDEYPGPDTIPFLKSPRDTDLFLRKVNELYSPMYGTGLVQFINLSYKEVCLHVSLCMPFCMYICAFVFM